MPTVLITGANRGLGLEFARQYAAEGAEVIATCRNPDAAIDLRALPGRIAVERLDVTSDDDARALAGRLAGKPIDIFVCNAGHMPPKVASLAEVAEADFLTVMLANVMGPIRVTSLFLDQIARSERKTIAVVSSRMGSMGENARGGAYLYRASKAALNAVMKSLSVDLAARGITVTMLHPGWAKTAMGGPNADIDLAVSVAGMRRAYETLTPGETGRFLNFTGEAIAW